MSRGARDYRAGKRYAIRPGSVYLLHFSRPFGHAQHYVGWSASSMKRLRQHGTPAGANLTRRVLDAGGVIALARVRRGSKRDEYRIKAAGGQRRYCPICTPQPRQGVWAA